MKNQILAAVFVLVGSSTSYAASPFHAEDFVSVPSLQGLEVQKSEITYAQWNALNAQLPAANQNPWEASNCHLKEYIAKGIGPNVAAACISFSDAEAYIRILNAQDPNYTYRLPMDSEMEILISTTLDSLRINGIISDEILSEHAWYGDTVTRYLTHDVCTKKSVLGLCDILGNIWEWNSTLVREYRIIRGGDFTNYGAVLRDGAYNGALPHLRLDGLGFRLVRTLK